MKILALTGGIGGAKLCLGLANVLAPDRVIFAVNVGDDFEHLGLYISPDLDTLTYTLANEVNPETGWGRSEESWQCITELERFGAPTWFRLGDRDLALHLVRSQKLRGGATLSEVTQSLCEGLGVQHAVVPISDDPIRTHVDTEQGLLSFQDYFVRRRCEPKVRAVEFRQPQRARLNPRIDLNAIDAVLICPSNPFLSIDPLLAVDDLTDFLKMGRVPVVAVSPIVGNRAIKGPTAKMMQELDMPSTSLRVAKYYEEIVNGFVVDSCDAASKQALEGLGMQVVVTPTIMNSLHDKIALAKACCEFLSELS